MYFVTFVHTCRHRITRLVKGQPLQTTLYRSDECGKCKAKTNRLKAAEKEQERHERHTNEKTPKL